jgi:ABC-type sugar transport system substrate-binding protein
MWKQYLKPTGKPVVILDLPMCNNADYTPGTAGIVTMQRPAYYQAVINNAFATCKTACDVAAVGGVTGSDLFTYWEDAITKGEAKYPNVHVVVNQPGDFLPATALSVMQAGLSANPHISMVVSSWDAMTQGVNQAITAAGKRPGHDIRIYSIGGTEQGQKYVENGTWNATYVLLPRQEGFYATIAAFMALAGHPLDAFVDEQLLPQVTSGPGTIVITAADAKKFHPTY